MTCFQGNRPELFHSTEYPLQLSPNIRELILDYLKNGTSSTSLKVGLKVGLPTYVHTFLHKICVGHIRLILICSNVKQICFIMLSYKTFLINVLQYLYRFN